MKAIPHRATKEKYKILLALKWDGLSVLALHDGYDVEPSDDEDEEKLEAAHVAAAGEAIGADLDDVGDVGFANDDGGAASDDSGGSLADDLVNLVKIMQEEGLLPMPLPEPVVADDHIHEHGVDKGVEDADDHAVDDAAGVPELPEPPVAPAPLPYELLSDHWWGVFKVKPENSGGVFGGYRVYCPFHKFSKKTGCKKQFRILGESVEEKTVTAKRIMMWCNGALRYSRQRRHRVDDPPFDGLPELGFLRACKITEHPSDVLDDEHLDAIEMPSDVEFEELQTLLSIDGGGVAPGAVAGAADIPAEPVVAPHEPDEPPAAPAAASPSGSGSSGSSSGSSSSSDSD